MLPLISYGQASIDGATSTAASAKLEARLNEILKSSGFPGFATTISRGDTTLFSKSFGYADKAKQTPYTLDTIQLIGSVSKTFIGFSILKAVEQGNCALDADINDTLPFKISNPHQPKNRITLRNLATHTSGLIDDEATYLTSYQLGNKPTVALEAFLQNYYVEGGKHYSKANFADVEVGKKYAYSNVASALAALVVARCSKTEFDAFTQAQIFTPLKMTSTHWFRQEAFNTRYTTLYEVNAQSHPLYKTILNADSSLKPYTAITYPDGGLHSSANDLTAYIKAMSQGYFGQAGLLSVENLAALFKPQFDNKSMPANMDKREPNRGIFWAYARNGSVRHTGSDPGVFSFISINPKTKIARVFLLNTQLEGDDNERAVKSFGAIVAALDEFEESTT